MALDIRIKASAKQPTRYYSDRQEKAIAKATGGKQTANSGATAFQKGDILISGSSSWLLEAKTKTSPSESISIKKEWFEKNRYEAAEMGKKYTALIFNFGPDEENHYVIDEWLFLELLEYLKTKDSE